MMRRSSPVKKNEGEVSRGGERRGKRGEGRRERGEGRGERDIHGDY